MTVWVGWGSPTRPAGPLLICPADVSTACLPPRVWIDKYAADQKVFFKDFAAAYIKLTLSGAKFA